MKSTHKPSRLLIAISVFLILSWPSGADFEMVNPVDFDLDNGYFLTLANTSGSSIETSNSSDSPLPSSIQVSLNGSLLRWQPDANITITYVRYDSIQDNLDFYANSTLSTLYTSAQMGHSNSSYLYRLDSSDQYNINSDALNWVSWNETISGGQHFLELLYNVTIPPAVGLITMTFTDTTCMRLGLCESEIHIYSSTGEYLGTIKSNEDFVKVKNASSIKMVIKPSQAGLLNDQNAFTTFIIKNIMAIFIAMILLGIIFIVIIMSYRRKT